MIPYLELTQIHLGPLTIQVWGLMVSIGILLGAQASARYAARFGTPKELIYSGAFWTVLAAFIGARALHVLGYEPLYYFQHPLEIIKIWEGGFSMFGGLIGAALGYSAWIFRHGLNWVALSDQMIYGLPLGLGCGRIGCFLIHDHPGTLTHFFLGVRYPDGVRHDHGLYLSINGFVMALMFFWLARKPRPAAFFIRFFMIWYGTVRFVLDFYRIADTTYAGLTPAQYLSVLMVLGGVIWSVKLRREKRKLLVGAA